MRLWAAGVSGLAAKGAIFTPLLRTHPSQIKEHKVGKCSISRSRGCRNYRLPKSHLPSLVVFVRHGKIKWLIPASREHGFVLLSSCYWSVWGGFVVISSWGWDQRGQTLLPVSLAGRILSRLGWLSHSGDGVNSKEESLNLELGWEYPISLLMKCEIGQDFNSIIGGSS